MLKDESKLEPIALPTAIVATKFDVYETYEPEKQKIIAKTLRFVAHFFGCCLVVIYFFYAVELFYKYEQLSYFRMYLLLVFELQK